MGLNNWKPADDQNESRRGLSSPEYSELFVLLGGRPLVRETHAASTGISKINVGLATRQETSSTRRSSCYCTCAL